jgi:hypothetical protein
VEDVFIKWFVDQSATAAFAGLLFYFYRKDVRQYTDMWQKQADLNQAATAAMMSLVERNMATITENTTVLKALHHRIDRLDILRFVPEGSSPGT